MIKEIFKEFNWKLPENNREEHKEKYSYKDIKMLLEYLNNKNGDLADVRLSLPDIKEIRSIANIRYPTTKPRHYLDEGKKLGFIEGVKWLIKRIEDNEA